MTKALDAAIDRIVRLATDLHGIESGREYLLSQIESRFPKSNSLTLFDDAPDWLVELRVLPDWPRDPHIESHLVNWVVNRGINGTSPLKAATYLVSAWATLKKKGRVDIIATFKNCVLKESEYGTNQQNSHGSHSDRGKYARERDLRG